MRLIIKRKVVEFMIEKYRKELGQCEDTEDLIRLMLKVAEREGLQLNSSLWANQF